MLQSTFSPQRVYVLGNGSLLDEGVTQVLSSKTQFMISGRKYKDDKTFLKDMELARPDIILVNETDSYDSLHILKLLSSVPSFIGVRVIFLRLYNNIVEVYDRRFEQDSVYDRQHIAVTSVSNDLVNIILSN